MTSMPEPINQRTVELAEGHVMHTCCFVIDDAEHWNFCPDWRPAAAKSPAEQLIDETVERWKAEAAKYRDVVSAETMAVVESLVARRDELTDAEICAIRAALDGPGLDDQGFAEEFLARQQQARKAAQRNAEAEQGLPPAHEQHPLSEHEQQLVDEAVTAAEDAR